LIAVPTPFKADHNGDHEPDLRFIEAASTSIAPVLKTGDLVMLRIAQATAQALYGKIERKAVG